MAGTTKCDNYYKVRQKCYDKLCQRLHRASDIIKIDKFLLQSSLAITKCDNYISKCKKYIRVKYWQYMGNIWTNI